MYPNAAPESPRDSSSLSGVTTFADEEEEEQVEHGEGSMDASLGPDNWEHEVAGLPVIEGIDPAQQRLQGTVA